MPRSVVHGARPPVSNRTPLGHLALVGLGVLLLLSVGKTPDARAQVDKEELRQKRSRADVRAEAQQSQPSLSVLDANNVPVWFQRNGMFPFVDPFTGVNDSFPKGAKTSTTFAQGLLWGGKVRDGGTDSLRVNGSTYQSGLAPGGLNPDGTPQDATNRERFHVWRVHRHWTSSAVLREAAAYVKGVKPGAVSESRIAEVRDQYAYDWTHWPAANGAPYEECNGQSGYQPADPEAVANGTSCADLDGDIPGRPGADQTIWVVTNDVGSNSEEDASRELHGSPATGMEVQFTLWAYERPAADPLGNANFIRSRLIYTGTPETPSDARIDSMFVSWWADADIGDFADDFAGVDTASSLGFAYNSDSNDDVFDQEGLVPAAGGWDVLKSLGAAAHEQNLSSFVSIPPPVGDPDLGNYVGTLEFYNVIRGVRRSPPYPDSEPIVNPITGEETTFMYPGDPVSGVGWVNGTPSDVQIASSSGPFTMEKGDTVDVVVGKMAAIGDDYLDSITKLRAFDEAVEYAFDAPISLPTDLSARMPSPNTLELNWAGVEDDDLDHYRIYRSTDPIAGHLTDLSPIDLVEATSYTEEGDLDTLQTYHYRVTAVSTSGEESIFSNEAVLPASQVVSDELIFTAYPNPVRQQSTLEYILPATHEVTLAVYDVLGRKVTTLARGEKRSGRHRVRLRTDQLASGVYFGRLQAGGETVTQKITVVH